MMPGPPTLARNTLLLTMAASAVFAALGPLPAKATSHCGTGRIDVAPPSGVGSDLDVTVYFTPQGGDTCAGDLYIELYAYAAGRKAGGPINTIRCPTAGAPNFCVKPSGQNYFQYHYLQQGFYTQEGVNYSFEARFYFGGTTANNWRGVVRSGEQASQTVPAGQKAEIKQAKEPPPIEAVLSVAIGKLTQTANIAVYLASLYNYVVSVVATLAIAMIVWGGVKYLTAGADPGRLKSAKDTIGNALIGLILSMASLLILNTINPRLTQLKNLNIPRVQRILFTPEPFCENIQAESGGQFKVTSETGKRGCGDPGRVLPAKEGGAVPLRENCVFKACPPETPQKFCTKISKNNYKCVPCAQQKGTSDGACAEFGGGIQQAYPPTSVSACVYFNHGGILDKPACYELVMNCGTIKKKGCTGYTENAYIVLSTFGFADNLALSKELRCFVTGTGPACARARVPEHLQTICEQNVCGVPGGGCKIAPSPYLQSIKKGLSADAITSAVKQAYLEVSLLSSVSDYFKADYFTCVPR